MTSARATEPDAAGAAKLDGRDRSVLLATQIIPLLSPSGHYRRNYYQVYASDTYFDPRGNLGVGAANRHGCQGAPLEVPVVAWCGDGGVVYYIQDLATAALHAIAVAGVIIQRQRLRQREGLLLIEVPVGELERN